MSSLEVSGIVFACVLAGAALGKLARARLPDHHLSPDSKDVVKLAMGIIGTMTALVLGLLVASAKSAFDAQRAGVSQLAANVTVLDRTLALYGPEAKDVRGLLRDSVADLLRRTWPGEETPGGTAGEKGATAGRYEEVYVRLLALEPKTDAQRTLQGQALKVAADTGQLRWGLAAQQRASSIPTPFLVVIVFWMAVIFGSFGLFAPGNATAWASLVVCSLTVSTAIFLILELDRPFTGVIQISSAPLRGALEQLGR